MRLLIHLIPFLSLFPALFSSLLVLSQTTRSLHHTDDNSSQSLLGSFLTFVTTALERATEEESLLLNKIGDINEVSRQEVDEMINMFARQVCVSSSDNIQKRYSLSQWRIQDSRAKGSQCKNFEIFINCYCTNILVKYVTGYRLKGLIKKHLGQTF
ncbi:hypothetical protein PRUPE_1G010000 [Prunus persica]|uniref:Uncharacterized protein n=1 Tax=Prunus persica TaxID=3760 RepID=A0A251QQW8_PRUPE|nr:hypothetical protein PRUPE_1G010000 [Prunus persica]